MLDQLPGTKVGKYDVISEIGRGGMSVVYRALDTHLERQVALKVMHSFLAQQPEARARLHREAVAVARLKHPNIVEIYDYSGESAEESYIAMELVEGFPLVDLLRKNAVQPPEAALVMFRPVVEALVQAHAHGIVHRDLKPENVLVGFDGTIKLTDFGIARILDSQTLTQTGTLLGSPAYMAPEYIEGLDSDARADIFSFGAMLYQGTVGRLPFEAPSPHALLKRIVYAQCTPPEQRNPKIHANIARLIKKCMATSPAERFQSAQEVLAAIDAILARVEIAPHTELPKLLADPDAFRARLEDQLVERYLALGKMNMAGQQLGLASEDFDRILSIRPEHAEVRKLVRRMARRARSTRIARGAVLAIAGAAIATFTIGSFLGRPHSNAPGPSGAASSDPNRSAATSLAPTDPGAATKAKRNVTFIINGRGDFYIDNTLVHSGASDALAYELSPGPHEARIANAQRTNTLPFNVPNEGPVAPIKIDVPLQAGGAQATPGPGGPIQPVTAAHRSPKNKSVQFRMAGGRWVNIYVDGQLLAKERQSPVNVDLSYGDHRVRFSNPCCEPEEISIRVGDDEPAVLEPIVLRPSPARLYIDGAPPGALVEVAGKRVGLNPGEPVYVPVESTEPATHWVSVSKGDHILLRTKAVFEAGRERRLAVQPNPL